MRAILITGGGLVAALLLPLLLIAALLGGLTTATPANAVNTAAIPALAAQHLDTIATLTATECPELPPLWVIAHVQAESSWDPAAFSSDRNGGAAGLYQLNEANWTAAGGAALRRGYRETANCRTVTRQRQARSAAYSANSHSSDRLVAVSVASSPAPTSALWRTSKPSCAHSAPMMARHRRV